MGETQEQKTASAILQAGELVNVGGAKYTVPPPTIATLILVSEHVSKLPKLQIKEDSNVVFETLRIAKDCTPVIDIVVTLLLGAKVMNSYMHFATKNKAYKRVLNLSPNELSELTLTLLKRHETESFFVLTTSLIEINMTKPTKEVES